MKARVNSALNHSIGMKCHSREMSLRLSCHRFQSNEVRLWLSVIAYNLGNLRRRLALPAGVANWSPTSLQQRLVKTGGRLIKHARCYWLLLAESHQTRRLFGDMLHRIVTLPVPAG
jgi:Transposase DDE domain group 1